ncbi:uncharacterized protein LOC124358684 [Homalodisca vitripennis]|uniref:uncharacterized protein LOC124358684 n=1 Tax=Homalodisca vitripennis TaxID=197043 RepID=UPI001EEACB4A|nr:uncharacterized protein LOC124358684 [Homalodisca vitripennis]
MLLTVCCILLASEAVQGGAFSKGAGTPYNLGTFGGQLATAVKVIRVTNTVAVPVPYPYPVTKHVPVPVSVPKPIPYAVPQPVPVEVTKPVVIANPVPFQIPKPYSVHQPFPTSQISYPLSLPGYLTAPQYHGNQATDYQAYVTYGSGGVADHSAPAYGHDQSYQPQQEYSYEGAQGVYEHGATNQEGYGQTDYSANNEPAGASGYGNSHGQNFESTNSVEEHSVAGHGNGY